MKKKERPIYTVCKNGQLMLWAGIGLVVVFTIIYFAIAIRSGMIDFYSFFFTNIKDNILLTILSGLHVSILAGGILLLISAFLTTSPVVRVYSDRFEFITFLTKNKVVYFKNLKRLVQSVASIRKCSVFKSDCQKQVLVFFENPNYAFYIAYHTDRYFDDIDLISKNDRHFISRRCMVRKGDLQKILSLVVSRNDNLQFPYLP